MAEHPGSAAEESWFPVEPVDRFIQPFTRFLHVEAASGLVLLACSILALVLANSPYAESFLGFWRTSVGISWNGYGMEHSLKHWINDGLMVIFFFVIGLEVKRELVLGELREIRRAALPVAAAIGGMVVPAGIYLALQAGEEGQRGWGIPMATDIAFVVGCMALLGPRVPAALRIMLLSLAIVDDIGAILVIAIGYTEALHLDWLVLGGVGIGVVLVMERIGVRSIGIYSILGIVIWVGFHESGIHATIAGVILGLMTPAHPYLKRTVGAELLSRASHLLHGDAWEREMHRAEKVRKYRQVTRETISPLEFLIYVLHPWVAFLIMPLFALANAGVAFEVADVMSPVAVAVILGLTVGKPGGILLLCWLASVSRIAPLPDGVTWRHIAGGGFLAGIGFTMALFITGLALDDELLRAAKVGVLAGSVISAVVGMVLLSTAPKSNPAPDSPESFGGDEVDTR